MPYSRKATPVLPQLEKKILIIYDSWMPESKAAAIGTITDLLRKAEAGDRKAVDRLFALLYDELRATARVIVQRGSKGTRKSDATDLVHAACQRLIERGKLLGVNRRHFFFQFTRAMKDLLVEQTRKDCAAKRKANRRPIDVALEFAWEDGALRAEMLDLNDALVELEQHDSVAAQVVSLRFFAGLNLQEVADVLPSTFSNVRDNWDYGRAWLLGRLERGKTAGSG